MDETLDRIHQLANERHRLWRLAGKNQITDQQRRRIDEITNELPLLWDKHRRELVARTSSRRPEREFIDRRIA